MTLLLGLVALRVSGWTRCCPATIAGLIYPHARPKGSGALGRIVDRNWVAVGFWGQKGVGRGVW